MKMMKLSLLISLVTTSLMLLNLMATSIKLVTADKKYDMHKDAEVAVNGGNFDEYFDNDGDAEAAYDGKTYALGKVVLNDKNDVVFV